MSSSSSSSYFEERRLDRLPSLSSSSSYFEENECLRRSSSLSSSLQPPTPLQSPCAPRGGGGCGARSYSSKAAVPSYHSARLLLLLLQRLPPVARYLTRHGFAPFGVAKAWNYVPHTQGLQPFTSCLPPTRRGSNPGLTTRRVSNPGLL